MENKVWVRLGVELSNSKEVIDKLNEGIKDGFNVSGIRINDILITRNQKNNKLAVLVINTEGEVGAESLIFTIKNKNISPYNLYKALRAKLKDFARRERRDKETLERLGLLDEVEVSI